MSHKSKIVIVIPAFNAEKYLKRSIESCLNQTVSTEIWVVDNCSDDKTVHIVKSLQRDNNNLKLYQNDINLGRIGNWNKCLDSFEESEFDFLKLLFMGDELEIDCIEKLHNITTLHNDLATISWPYKFVDDKKVALEEPLFENSRLLTKEDLVEHDLFPGHYLGAIVSVLLSKKSVSQNRFEDQYIGIIPFYDRALLKGNSYYIAEHLSVFNIDSHMTFHDSLGPLTVLESGYCIMNDLENNSEWIHSDKYKEIQNRELSLHIKNISEFLSLSKFIILFSNLLYIKIFKTLKAFASKIK